MELMMEYMARGFIIMLSISMPCVLTAASIGLIVGILQAVTQVQEQTIAAAPKILAVFMVIIIGGVGFVRMLNNFFIDGMAIAFNVLPKNDAYVLSSDYYKYTKPFAGEMNENFSDSEISFQDMTRGTNKGSFDKEKAKKYQIYKRGSFNTLPQPDLLEQKKIMER